MIIRVDTALQTAFVCGRINEAPPRVGPPGAWHTGLAAYRADVTLTPHKIKPAVSPKRRQA